MKSTRLKNALLAVVLLVDIFCFVVWVNLPQYVPIHYLINWDADIWGSKWILTVGFLFPLFSFWPWFCSSVIGKTEYHVDDEYSRSEKEKEEMKLVLAGFMIAAIFCFLEIGMMLSAYFLTRA